MPSPKLPQPSGAVHSIWWLGFFLTSSPILDLEHFSQVILWIVLQIMPSPNYPNHQVLFTASDGWVFLHLFSYSGLRAFFTSDLTNCTTDYAHPPKLPQPSGAVHSIWWLGFFLTSSPILDLEHFSQVILRIVLQIMPTPQNNPNHQVLFTASDGWGFFFYLFSYSGLRAFFTSDLRIVLQIMPPPQINPTIRCCSQHLMVGGFFLTSFPILDLEHFSQMILWIVLQIMPSPKLPQPSGAVHSIWWLGFFLTSSPILDLEHFSQVISWIVLQIMPSPNYPNHQVLFTASDGWVFFTPLLLFWT